MANSRSTNPNPDELKKTPNQPQNQSETSADKFPLDELPSDLLKITTNRQEEVISSSIGQYLSPIAKKALAKTCNKFLFSIFEPDIEPANKLIQEFFAHVAYGRKEEAGQLLEKNPDLVLVRGKKVITPGGLTFTQVSAYECALLGDPEMALMIGGYFEKFEGGVEKRAAQYKRYEKAIENMSNVKPYDFTNLIKTIKQSLAKDVTAELATGKNHDPSYKSALRDELEKFRKVFAPCTKKTPEEQFAYISFIYMSLLEAFKVYAAEWNNLDDDKCRLVWRQLIGFIERRLPAVDRQAFAQDVDTIKSLSEMVRSMHYKHDPQNEFPRTEIDDATHSGLGFDSGVSIYGGGQGRIAMWHVRDTGSGGFEKLCRAKASGFEKVKQQLQHSSAQHEVNRDTHKFHRCMIV